MKFQSKALAAIAETRWQSPDLYRYGLVASRAEQFLRHDSNGFQPGPATKADGQILVKDGRAVRAVPVQPRSERAGGGHIVRPSTDEYHNLIDYKTALFENAQSDPDIQFKLFGRRRRGRTPSIGRAARNLARRIPKAVPYDHNAVDGDGDGLIQEGTIWERPAGTKYIRVPNGSMSLPSAGSLVDVDGKPVSYKPGQGVGGKKPIARAPLGAAVGQGLRRAGTSMIERAGQRRERRADRRVRRAERQMERAGRDRAAARAARNLGEAVDNFDKHVDAHEGDIPDLERERGDEPMKGPLREFWDGFLEGFLGIKDNKKNGSDRDRERARKAQARGAKLERDRREAGDEEGNDPDRDREKEIEALLAELLREEADGADQRAVDEAAERALDDDDPNARDAGDDLVDAAADMDTAELAIAEFQRAVDEVDQQRKELEQGFDDGEFEEDLYVQAIAELDEVLADIEQGFQLGTDDPRLDDPDWRGRWDEQVERAHEVRREMRRAIADTTGDDGLDAEESAAVADGREAAQALEDQLDALAAFDLDGVEGVEQLEAMDAHLDMFERAMQQAFEDRDNELFGRLNELHGRALGARNGAARMLDLEERSGLDVQKAERAWREELDVDAPEGELIQPITFGEDDRIDPRGGDAARRREGDPPEPEGKRPMSPKRRRLLERLRKLVKARKPKKRRGSDVNPYGPPGSSMNRPNAGQLVDVPNATDEQIDWGIAEQEGLIFRDNDTTRVRPIDGDTRSGQPAYLRKLLAEKKRRQNAGEWENPTQRRERERSERMQAEFDAVEADAAATGIDMPSAEEIDVVNNRFPAGWRPGVWDYGLPNHAFWRDNPDYADEADELERLFGKYYNEDGSRNALGDIAFRAAKASSAKDGAAHALNDVEAQIRYWEARRENVEGEDADTDFLHWAEGDVEKWQTNVDEVLEGLRERRDELRARGDTDSTVGEGPLAEAERTWAEALDAAGRDPAEESLVEGLRLEDGSRRPYADFIEGVSYGEQVREWGDMELFVARRRKLFGGMDQDDVQMRAIEREQMRRLAEAPDLPAKVLRLDDRELNAFIRRLELDRADSVNADGEPNNPAAAALMGVLRDEAQQRPTGELPSLPVGINEEGFGGEWVIGGWDDARRMLEVLEMARTDAAAWREAHESEGGAKVNEDFAEHHVRGLLNAAIAAEEAFEDLRDNTNVNEGDVMFDPAPWEAGFNMSEEDIEDMLDRFGALRRELEDLFNEAGGAGRRDAVDLPPRVPSPDVDARDARDKPVADLTDDELNARVAQLVARDPVGFDSDVGRALAEAQAEQGRRAEAIRERVGGGRDRILHQPDPPTDDPNFDRAVLDRALRDPSRENVDRVERLIESDLQEAADHENAGNLREAARLREKARIAREELDAMDAGIIDLEDQVANLFNADHDWDQAEMDEARRLIQTLVPGGIEDLDPDAMNEREHLGLMLQDRLNDGGVNRGRFVQRGAADADQRAAPDSAEAAIDEVHGAAGQLDRVLAGEIVGEERRALIDEARATALALRLNADELTQDPRLNDPEWRRRFDEAVGVLEQRLAVVEANFPDEAEFFEADIDGSLPDDRSLRNVQNRFPRHGLPRRAFWRDEDYDPGGGRDAEVERQVHEQRFSRYFDDEGNRNVRGDLVNAILRGEQPSVLGIGDAQREARRDADAPAIRQLDDGRGFGEQVREWEYVELIAWLNNAEKNRRGSDPDRQPLGMFDEVPVDRRAVERQILAHLADDNLVDIDGNVELDLGAEFLMDDMLFMLRRRIYKDYNDGRSEWLDANMEDRFNQLNVEIERRHGGPEVAGEPDSAEAAIQEIRDIADRINVEGLDEDALREAIQVHADLQAMGDAETRDPRLNDPDWRERYRGAVDELGANIEAARAENREMVERIEDEEGRGRLWEGLAADLVSDEVERIVGRVIVANPGERDRVARERVPEIQAWVDGVEGEANERELLEAAREQIRADIASGPPRGVMLAPIQRRLAELDGGDDDGAERAAREVWGGGPDPRQMGFDALLDELEELQNAVDADVAAGRPINRQQQRRLKMLRDREVVFQDPDIAGQQEIQELRIQDAISVANDAMGRPDVTMGQLDDADERLVNLHDALLHRIAAPGGEDRDTLLRQRDQVQATRDLIAIVQARFDSDEPLGPRGRTEALRYDRGVARELLNDLDDWDEGTKRRAALLARSLSDVADDDPDGEQARNLALLLQSRLDNDGRDEGGMWAPGEQSELDAGRDAGFPLDASRVRTDPELLPEEVPDEAMIRFGGVDPREMAYQAVLDEIEELRVAGEQARRARGSEHPQVTLRRQRRLKMLRDRAAILDEALGPPFVEGVEAVRERRIENAVDEATRALGRARGDAPVRAGGIGRGELNAVAERLLLMEDALIGRRDRQDGDIVDREWLERRVRLVNSQRDKINNEINKLDAAAADVDAGVAEIAEIEAELDGGTGGDDAIYDTLFEAIGRVLGKGDDVPSLQDLIDHQNELDAVIQKRKLGKKDNEKYYDLQVRAKYIENIMRLEKHEDLEPAEHGRNWRRLSYMVAQLQLGGGYYNTDRAMLNVERADVDRALEAMRRFTGGVGRVRGVEEEHRRRIDDAYHKMRGLRDAGWFDLDPQDRKKNIGVGNADAIVDADADKWGDEARKKAGKQIDDLLKQLAAAAGFKLDGEGRDEVGNRFGVRGLELDVEQGVEFLARADRLLRFYEKIHLYDAEFRVGDVRRVRDTIEARLALQSTSAGDLTGGVTHLRDANGELLFQNGVQQFDWNNANLEGLYVGVDALVKNVNRGMRGRWDGGDPEPDMIHGHEANLNRALAAIEKHWPNRANLSDRDRKRLNSVRTRTKNAMKKLQAEKIDREEKIRAAEVARIDDDRIMRRRFVKAQAFLGRMDALREGLLARVADDPDDAKLLEELKAIDDEIEADHVGLVLQRVMQDRGEIPADWAGVRDRMNEEHKEVKRMRRVVVERRKVRENREFADAKANRIAELEQIIANNDNPGDAIDQEIRDLHVQVGELPPLAGGLSESADALDQQRRDFVRRMEGLDGQVRDRVAIQKTRAVVAKMDRVKELEAIFADNDNPGEALDAEVMALLAEVKGLPPLNNAHGTLGDKRADMRDRLKEVAIVVKERHNAGLHRQKIAEAEELIGRVRPRIAAADKDDFEDIDTEIAKAEKLREALAGLEKLRGNDNHGLHKRRKEIENELQTLGAQLADARKAINLGPDVQPKPWDGEGGLEDRLGVDHPMARPDGMGMPLVKGADGISRPVAVPKGNAGLKTQLDADRHVRAGGDIADVPDEYLGTALMANTSQTPGMRFLAIQDKNSGIHATQILLQRLPDGTYGKSGYILKDSSGSDGLGEYIGAALGHRVGMMMSPARVDGRTKGINRGNPTKAYDTIVMEHAGNNLPSPENWKFGGKAISGRSRNYALKEWPDRNNEAALRQRLNNAIHNWILGVSDRHENNGIAAIGPNGEMLAYPIDLAWVFREKKPSLKDYVDSYFGMDREVLTATRDAAAANTELRTALRAHVTELMKRYEAVMGNDVERRALLSGGPYRDLLGLSDQAIAGMATKAKGHWDTLLTPDGKLDIDGILKDIGLGE